MIKNNCAAAIVVRSIVVAYCCNVHNTKNNYANKSKKYQKKCRCRKW